MRLGEDFIDEIKARIRLSDLIGRTVPLKRAGNEMVGLSPFKKEKTPSFYVNDEKRFYHCFSSGKHGDAFSWLAETEGLSFMEAAERLAGLAGLRLPEPDPEAQQKAERRKSLIEWMEAAQAHFEAELRSARGEAAREYLTRRGLTGEDCRRFGIGFAPDSRSGLKDKLISAGALPEELIECGLLIRPDNGSPYDRFRDRVMFPIHDPRGRLVAFGGRALSKEARAKYMNSPETTIFHKGSTLYRFPEARRAALDAKSGARGLIVAEGYMDAIALARAGLDHAVAPLGTAVTPEQLELMWRVGGEPVLCFDGDSAGRRAALTAADRALPLLKSGRTLRFVFLPEGKDPDDLLRDAGAGALRAALEQTRPLVDLIWDREVEAEPLDDPDRRAAFRRRMRAAINRIEDGEVKAEYRREIDTRMEALFGVSKARRAGGGGRRDWRGKGEFESRPSAALKAAMAKRGAAGPNLTRGGHLLLAAVEWPHLALEHMETLALLPLGPLDSLRDGVLDACSSGLDVQDGGLRAALEQSGHRAELRRLESERGPMTASMGGEEASESARNAAWMRLAAAYIEQDEARAGGAERRARFEEELTRDDAESLRKLVEARLSKRKS
jgi:DNA primase